MGLEAVIEASTFDNRFAADNKLYVVFAMHAVQNGFRTEQEGRPIYDDVPHVRIHVPGDKTSVVERPVIEEDKMRFPVQWEKFQKNMSQAPEGTPLEQWPLLTIGQVFEFKALNIFTVEQLAGIADTQAQRFMGGHEMRRKAVAFLASAKNTAEAQRLATANAELEQRLDAKDEIIRQMGARLEALEAKQKK
jgi:hypothetical protein